MKNLQQATERICELKGSLVAMDALCCALIQQMPGPSLERLAIDFGRWAEAARTSMLHAAISELSIAQLEADVQRMMALLASLQRQSPPLRPPPLPLPPSPAPPRATVESLLLTVPRVSTFQGQAGLTGASGFFFERDERLYLVTSRHVLIDEASGHFPDRLEIEVHTDRSDLARTAVFSLLLYENGRARWHQAEDSGGEIDVAAIPLQRKMLEGLAICSFTPAHLQQALGDVQVGTPLLVIGFPLGFADSRHHLPVARQAAVASSFGTRFQGKGMFLTDARTHRGISGAPVVMHQPGGPAASQTLPWTLLGIHSSRMDMGGRDLKEDESLGLNCAWYADILLTLTKH